MKLKFEIVLEADEAHGAMDALWTMWVAFRDGNTPMGGSCPACMGDAYNYSVKDISPKPEADAQQPPQLPPVAPA